jgi:uncharacterized repeat protein (TIGR01451 family)
MSAIPVDGAHYSIATYQGQIYLAGSSSVFGIEGIVRWDSASNQWLSVGGGISTSSTSAIIHDLEVFQGELYAAGSFDNIGGIPVRGLAKWDGTSWDSVGNQNLLTPSQFAIDVYLYELHTWNNKLVVGGQFEVANTQHVAMWDGAAWTGFSADSPDREVEEMATYQGDLIIYGPWIEKIGTTPTQHMARWDGSTWQQMGIATSDFVDIRDMLQYKGELYVTGSSDNIYSIGGGQPFEGAAKWNGSQWHVLTGFVRQGHQLREYKSRLYLAGNLAFSCNIPLDHVVKLCTYPECQAVSGKVYQDDNSNCIPDGNEFPMIGQWINIQPGNYLIPTDANGEYYYLVDTGTTTVTVNALPNYYSGLCPATGHTINLDTAGGSNLNFGYVPVPNVTDVAIEATATRFRPGFTGRLYLNIENVGTLPQNGTIQLTLDSAMTAGMSSQTSTGQTGQTLTWNYAGLSPTQTDRLWLEASIDTTTRLGDTLCIIANIFSNVGADADTLNNVDTLKVIVTGSYDPNDKQVVPAGRGADGDIPYDTETLTYTVRFQNTGTDTAFTVVIRDEIDADLDLSTMSILGASHAYRFEIEEGQKVNWTFDNILLPDSNINEPASHGFIKYTISLKPNLPIGTQIENTAFIYFDFNAPIITNTTVNTLANFATSISPVIKPNALKMWPNPATHEANFQIEKPVHQARMTILDLQGRTVAMKRNITEQTFSIPLYDLLPGMYMYRLEESGKVLGVGKMIVE